MDKSSQGAYPQQATWQTGTPASDVASRLATAKITKNPNYSYGTSPVGGSSQPFFSNGLLAAEQINNTLTLISYTSALNGVGGPEDQKLPFGSVILSLCNNAACTNAPK